MYCINCGKAQKNGAVFCSSCGTKQELDLTVEEPIAHKTLKSTSPKRNFRLPIIIATLFVIIVAIFIVRHTSTPSIVGVWEGAVDRERFRIEFRQDGSGEMGIVETSDNFEKEQFFWRIEGDTLISTFDDGHELREFFEIRGNVLNLDYFYYFRISP